MSLSVASVQSGWVRHRLPRSLHPVAWWLWALGIMTAASLTTNPLVEGLLLAATTFVVVARRDDGPWAKSFRLYAFLGAAVFALRIVYRILFGGADGDHVLFTLPRIPLPSIVAGVRLLGPVSLESILSGAYDGLRLATIIVAGIENAVVVGGVAALAAALYSIGVPKDSVLQYESAIKADSFLVMARGTAEEIARAKTILGATNPLRLDIHRDEDAIAPAASSVPAAA